MQKADPKPPSYLASTVIEERIKSEIQETLETSENKECNVNTHQQNYPNCQSAGYGSSDTRWRCLRSIENKLPHPFLPCTRRTSACESVGAGILRPNAKLALRVQLLQRATAICRRSLSPQRTFSVAGLACEVRRRTVSFPTCDCSRRLKNFVWFKCNERLLCFGTYPYSCRSYCIAN